MPDTVLARSSSRLAVCDSGLQGGDFFTQPQPAVCPSLEGLATWSLSSDYLFNVCGGAVQPCSDFCLTC